MGLGAFGGVPFEGLSTPAPMRLQEGGEMRRALNRAELLHYLAKEGWQLECSMTMDGMSHLRGPANEFWRARSDSVYALYKAGKLKVVRERWPARIYKLAVIMPDASDTV